MFLLSLSTPTPLQCPWRQLLQESLPEPREVFVSVQLPLLKVLSLPLSIGLPLPQPLSLLLTIQVQTKTDKSKLRASNALAQLYLVSLSAGREAGPGRLGVTLAPGPGPTRPHLARDGTIANLAAPPLRTSPQLLFHLTL